MLCVVVNCASVNLPAAEDGVSGTLLVKDALTTPGQPVTIEARLNAKGFLTTTGMGGEPLHLIVDGEVVALGMTGGDGKAFIRYSTKAQGVIPIAVRVGKTTRVQTTEGHAHIAVWEQRNPIVAIELSSLMEVPAAHNPFPGMGLHTKPQWKPMPDATVELTKLTQFYYRVIYVVSLPSSDADGFLANATVREWLNAHQFPPGYILILPPGAESLGTTLDALHKEGWKTVKTGVGRSKAFIETFLQRRLEAVMIPESATSDVPRKAKVAKDWKEVRKKL